jgi:hypothetical protein
VRLPVREALLLNEACPSCEASPGNARPAIACILVVADNPPVDGVPRGERPLIFWQLESGRLVVENDI